MHIFLAVDVRVLITNFSVSAQNALLDLLGESDIPSLDHTAGNASAFATAPAASSGLDILDLLGDINLSAPVPVLPTSSSSSTVPQTLFGNGAVDGVLGGGLFDDGLMSPSVANNNHLGAALDGGLLGGLIGNDFGAANATLGSAAASAAQPAAPMIVLDQNGINVTLVPQRQTYGLQVLMTATNRSAEPIEQFQFQAAVQRSFALQLLPPSGTVLAAGGGVITQEVRLSSRTNVSGDGVLNLSVSNSGFLYKGGVANASAHLVSAGRRAGGARADGGQRISGQCVRIVSESERERES